jgi:hypothetical protein
MDADNDGMLTREELYNFYSAMINGEEGVIFDGAATATHDMGKA